MCFSGDSLLFNCQMQEETSPTQLQLKNFLTAQDIQELAEKICKHPPKNKQEQPATVEEKKFACHKIQEESDCMTAFEFKQAYLYVFAKNKINTCELTLVSFQKSDGTQYKTTIRELAAPVNCLKLQLCFSSPSSNLKSANPKFKLLVGSSDGFLKILYLEKPYFFTEVKLDHKPIVYIQQGHYQLFGSHNVCMALTSDSQVHFVDTDTSQVVYILRPQILMCDSALSLALHPLRTHLLQTTQGGYLIFWELGPILKNIQQRRQMKGESCTRVFDLFPHSIDHSVALDGLLWATFYGNTIIVLTREGQLKIVAFIFDNEMEHIELASHKVQHPEYVTDMKLFPEDGLILISSNHGHPHLQQLAITPNFDVVHLRNIRVLEIEEIRDFYLTSQFNIMLCRAHKAFVINQCPPYLCKQKPGQQKREEDI